ncbi:MAG: hypothetical protein ACYDHX_10060 [Methanothrix sp.]
MQESWTAWLLRYLALRPIRPPAPQSHEAACHPAVCDSPRAAGPESGNWTLSAWRTRTPQGGQDVLADLLLR